jgi:hypothetical protein
MLPWEKLARLLIITMMEKDIACCWAFLAFDLFSAGQSLTESSPAAMLLAFTDGGVVLLKAGAGEVQETLDQVHLQDFPTCR